MKKSLILLLSILTYVFLVTSCAEIPPASSEPNDPSATPEPTPTEAVSATPEATPTPVPTKKPTTAPTPKPTATIKPMPEYDPFTKWYIYYEPDALLDAIVSLDPEKTEQGRFKSAILSARENGYIYMPRLENGVSWSVHWKTSLNAERAGAASGITYRIVYEGHSALVDIYNLDVSVSAAAVANPTAYYAGKSGNALDESVLSRKELFCAGEMRTTYGYPIQDGDKYRIFFVYDEKHMISVDWETKSAAEAEEYMTKLEFEKVELKTGKPTLPSTPITPEAGITPIVTPPVGEIIPNA